MIEASLAMAIIFGSPFVGMGLMFVLEAWAGRISKGGKK